ncbi:hypothetical protein [Tabrizicola sp.]|uniref:hypothetical protein n=1 Tax=Tabrizicola sp. TaxID=2005166 RepID=UPI00286CD1A8|nr:hypothetical protein [Tabrizicola sp.]
MSTHRPVTPRLWGSLALAGAALSFAGSAGAHGVTAPVNPAQERVWLADATGGEAGEAGAPAVTEGGEGGEAGSVASGDATVDFLAGLLQIEGHLASGFALWQNGEKENGLAHMGHPKAEVYEAIEGMLTEFGPPQFEVQLDQLVEAAANGAPDEALNAMYANIVAQIGVAREAAVAADPKDDFTAIVHLIRKAGDEWGEGVKDGALVELHEYQDAWGFVQAARDRATVLSASADPVIKAAADATLAALDELSPALPAVLPTGPIEGDAGYFAAAAAKIELAAFKVK